MRSVASWLSIMFLGLFWIFRIIVTVAAQYGGGLGDFIVFDNTVEIALLFVSLLCFGLILKRIIWGSVLYTIFYGWYLGAYLVNNFFPALFSESGIDMVVAENAFVAILGIILAVFTLIISIFEKTKLKHFSGDKTEWFMNNDKYDRNYDERADKNQYRTL